MESRRVELLLVCLLMILVSQTCGLFHAVKPNVNGWREKRQSHPKATFARIPEVAFLETRAALPGLVEYLIPPPPGDSQSSASQVSGDVRAWDLGYDANDLLVPPGDQTRQYNTLKVFTLVPTSGETDSLPVLDSSESDTSGPSSAEDPSSQEYRRDQRTAKFKGPVYTYVKTDKHGHFKWGVRHGN